MITKRLSPDAKVLLLAATSEAAALRAEQVGGEHILLACLSFRGSLAADYLADAGVDRLRIATLLNPADEDAGVVFDDSDAEALAGLGIDLPQVLLRLEENVGSPAREAARPRRRPGPPRRSRRFADCASSTVKRAAVEAATLKSKSVEPTHVLLSALREPSTCCQDVVSALGLDYDSALRFMFPAAP